MNGIQTQIVRAYEEIHLSVEDIANEQELSPLEVKAVLMQYSSVYRDAIQTESGAKDDFTDDEAAMAKQAMIQLMGEAVASGEDKDLAFRIAKYIRNDKKGRLDKTNKGFNQLNIGVAVFNTQLAKMHDAIGRVKASDGSKQITQGPAPQTIDIPVEVHQQQDKAA